ncbi:hypothetical protein NEUTE2DRAFT_106636, partial [Neurospora tetrasperma FGSC 2509]
SSRLHHQYNLNQSHRSNNIKTTPTDRNGFCYQRNHCRVQRRSFHCHRDSHLGFVIPTDVKSEPQFRSQLTNHLTTQANQPWHHVVSYSITPKPFKFRVSNLAAIRQPNRYPNGRYQRV